MQNTTDQAADADISISVSVRQADIQHFLSNIDSKDAESLAYKMLESIFKVQVEQGSNTFVLWCKAIGLQHEEA